MSKTMVGIVLGGLLFCVACDAEPTGHWRVLGEAGPASGLSRYARLVNLDAIASVPPGSPTGLFLLGGTSDCPGDSVTDGVYRWQWDAGEEPTGDWVPDPTWPSVTGAGLDLYGIAAAYDEEREELVAFGGFGLLDLITQSCPGDTNPTASFFTRDADGWMDRSGDSPMPAPRGNATLFYDRKAGEIMLFGGMGSGGVLTDLWAWNGSAWEGRDYEAGCDDPPQPLDFASAYDPYREELILVGTTQEGGFNVTHTWGLADHCWSYYGEAGEPIPHRWAASMAVDPARGRLVLTGGVDFGVDPIQERPGTWEWNGWEWISIQGESPAVWGAGFAVESSRGAMLLYGSLWQEGSAVPITLEYEGPQVPSRYNAQSCESAGGELGLALLLLFGLALPRRRRASLLLLLALLLPATGRAEEPRQIAYLGMLNTNGVDATDADTISGVLQTYLGQSGKNKVIGPSDIKAMLGLEGQKQLLGCEADSSCLAELGGALGARHAAYADLNKLGSTAVFNLTLLDVENTQVVSRISRTVKLEDTLEPVLELLEGAVSDLFAPLKDEGAADPSATVTAVTTEADETPTTPAAATAPEAPAVVPPASEAGPSRFAHLSEGFYLQARLDVDLYKEGGLGAGGTLGWGRSILAPQITLLASEPVIFRLEAKLAPLALGPAYPYLALGFTFSNPALAPRGAAGVELRLGHLHFFLEGAYENYVLNMKRFEKHAILVAAGAGWRF